jgi:WD40 repeat protein/predicted small lipoprotein YifL
MKRNFSSIIIGLLVSSLLLAACGKKASEPLEFTATSLPPSKTATLTPSPTLTPTRTQTPKPTLTTTQTPTETMQSDDRGLSLTPIPLLNEIILPETIDRIGTLAAWGNGRANTIVLSPDGNTLAIGTGIGAFLYDSVNFGFITSLLTPFPVHAITFSPNNLSIALGQSQGRIDVYELERQTLVTRLTVSGVPFSDPHRVRVLFSGGGAYLTYLTEINNNLYINRWSTASWRVESVFVLDNGLVTYVNPLADLVGIVTPSQLILQSLGFSEESRFIDLPTSLPRAYWEGIPLNQGEIAPSSAGDFILINNGTSILLWSFLEDDISYSLDQYPTQLPNPCFDAPQTCRNRRGGFSWSCPQGLTLPPIETIVLTPDNTMFLVSRNDLRSEFRRTSNGSLLWEIGAHFTDVAFSPNSEYFFGLRLDGSIEKRSIINGELLFPLNQHPTQLTGVRFSPDGSILAVGYTDGWIRVYSPFNGEMLGVLNGSASALRFSPDGSLLAGGLLDGTVRIYELNQGRYFDLIGGHSDSVTSLAFSPDGRTLLSGGRDCRISIWDMDGRFRRQILNPGGTDPFQITALEGGNLSGDQYLLGNQNSVFQVSESDISELFAPANASTSDIALSRDGQLLGIAGSSTWLIPVLDRDPVRRTQTLIPITGDDGHVLAFTPNGAVMIVATADGLEFWSTSTGASLGYLPFSPPSQGTNLPMDLAVSPDGSLIVVGRQDGLLHVLAVIDQNP